MSALGWKRQKVLQLVPSPKSRHIKVECINLKRKQILRSVGSARKGSLPQRINDENVIYLLIGELHEKQKIYGKAWKIFCRIQENDLPEWHQLIDT